MEGSKQQETITMDKIKKDSKLAPIWRHGRGYPGRCPYLGDSGTQQLNSLNSQMPKQITKDNFDSVMKIMVQRMDLFISSAWAEIACESGSQCWEYRQLEKFEKNMEELQKLIKMGAGAFNLPLDVPESKK